MFVICIVKIAPIGTFALTSLMLGNALTELVPNPENADGAAWSEVYDRRSEKAITIMFISGLSMVNILNTRY